MPQVGNFSWNQSSQQCFYFITGISGVEMLSDDIIVAYKDDKVVGAAQWSGQYTTVPTMGDEGEEYTEGYMFPGDIPIFKLYRQSSDEFITLTVPGGTPPWSPLGQPFILLSVETVPEPEPSDLVSAVTVIDGQLVIFKVEPGNMIQ